MNPLRASGVWPIGFVFGLILSVGPTLSAQETLGDLSIEQLMNESVTSVSKKATTLAASPAAVTVVTDEDILRSGFTSIPEALRMVPGLDVARINGDEWAISSRGFNSPFANKLLVLVDGLTVYTPGTAGVFWNAQDMILEDLDRIEIIRGPQATLWGANAVNGVINLTTKSAKETLGGLLSVSEGTEDRPSVAFRYGGVLAPNLYYRVYAKAFDRAPEPNDSGTTYPANWESQLVGMRVDWIPSAADTVTLESKSYHQVVGVNVAETSLAPPYYQTIDAVERNDGSDVLGRWSHDFSDTSILTAQTYYNHAQQDTGWGIESDSTADFEVQQQAALGSWNELVGGIGYRSTEVSQPAPEFNVQWPITALPVTIFNVFVQDDIIVEPGRWHLLLGSKSERSNLVGWQWEPSARLVWTPNSQQTLWTAVSRATRTPSLYEREGRVNLAASAPTATEPTVLISRFGDPQAEAEDLTAFEMGYRVQVNPHLSVDVATFYNRYTRLLTDGPVVTEFETVPAPAHLLLASTTENLESGRTYGAEIAIQWEITAAWRVVASSTLLHMDLSPDPSAEGDSPKEQYQVRSYVTLPDRVELSAAAYYVGSIDPVVGIARLPLSSYFRFDLGVSWRPIPALEFGVWGENLSRSRHYEFGSDQSPILTAIPRSVRGKSTWHF